MDVGRPFLKHLISLVRLQSNGHLLLESLKSGSGLDRDGLN